MSWEEKFRHLKETSKDILGYRNMYGYPEKVVKIISGQYNTASNVRTFIDALKPKAEKLSKGGTSEAVDYIKRTKWGGEFHFLDSPKKIKEVEKIAGDCLNRLATFLEEKINDPKFSYSTSFITHTALKSMIDDSRQAVLNDAVHSGIYDKFGKEIDTLTDTWSKNYDKKYKEKHKDDPHYKAYIKCENYFAGATAKGQNRKEFYENDDSKDKPTIEEKQQFHSYVNEKRYDSTNLGHEAYAGYHDAISSLINAAVKSAGEGLKKTGRSSIKIH